jgi:medium-chain acyl-[acyl-carrier-protein] hydrolase
MKDRKDHADRIAALSPYKQKMLLQQLKQKTAPQVNPPLSPHSTADGWIFQYKRSPQAPFRLFCFPYAGGVASLFRPWSDALWPEVEICCIQLPGRENRVAEPPYTRMAPLVQTLAQAIHPYLDKPFGFFGHSMGALISFELARQLRRRNDRLPVRLCIAAHGAPHLLVPSTRQMMNCLPPEMFKEVLRYEGVSEHVLQNEVLMQSLLPTLQADFELCDTYVYTDEPPLESPFSIFGGLQDTRTSIASLEAWRTQSSKACSLRMLPGSHFFLHSAQDLLLAGISQDLATQVHVTSIGSSS